MFGSLAQDYVSITRHNDSSEEPMRLAQECLNRIRSDLGCAVATSCTAGNTVLTVQEIDPNAVRFPAGTTWDPSQGTVNVVYKTTSQGLTRQQGSLAAEVLSSTVNSLTLTNTSTQLMQIDLNVTVGAVSQNQLSHTTVSTQVFVMTWFL